MWKSVYAFACDFRMTLLYPLFSSLSHRDLMHVLLAIIFFIVIWVHDTLSECLQQMKSIYTNAVKSALKQRQFKWTIEKLVSSLCVPVYPFRYLLSRLTPFVWPNLLNYIFYSNNNNNTNNNSSYINKQWDIWNK